MANEVLLGKAPTLQFLTKSRLCIKIKVIGPNFLKLPSIFPGNILTSFASWQPPEMIPCWPGQGRQMLLKICTSCAPVSSLARPRLTTCNFIEKTFPFSLRVSQSAMSPCTTAAREWAKNWVQWETELRVLNGLLFVLPLNSRARWTWSNLGQDHLWFLRICVGYWRLDDRCWVSWLDNEDVNPWPGDCDLSRPIGSQYLASGPIRVRTGDGLDWGHYSVTCWDCWRRQN